MPDRRHLVAVGTALLISVLAGCSAAPSAAPVHTPQTSVTATSSAPTSPPPTTAGPSSPPVTGATASPTPVASETPSPTPAVSGSPSPTPRSSPSPPATNTYAASVALSGNQLSYTRLRWYWGKDAQARCKKQHLHSETEWCNDYYYENTHRPGHGTLAPDAKIRLLSDDGQLHTGTATELSAAIRSGTWRFYRIWSAKDQIVRLEQVFTP